MAAERSAVAPTAGAESLALIVRLLDADRNPLPDGAYTGEVTILFPFIAGSLFGEPDQAAAIRKRVHVGDRLRFDLRALRGPIQSAAAPWRDGVWNQSLQMTPRETRLVRLGTVSLRDDGEPFADQTVLIEQGHKDTFLLVYVDRPCSIRGTNRTGTGTAEHAIDFPAEGFHWVRAHQLEPGRSRLTYEPLMRDPSVGLQVFRQEKRSRGQRGNRELSLE